jgi:hypothetical protein
MNNSDTIFQSVFQSPYVTKQENDLGRLSLESVNAGFISKEKSESLDKLKEVVVDSSEVLATARTTMTLFPDTLTLDKSKVTVTKRTFVSTSEVISMRIEDILSASVSLGPLFGSVKVLSRVMTPDKPTSIGLFWRKDAIRMKRLIQGYVMARQKEIDCSHLTKDELVETLDMMGEDNHTN